MQDLTRLPSEENPEPQKENGGEKNGEFKEFIEPEYLSTDGEGIFKVSEYDVVEIKRLKLERRKRMPSIIDIMLRKFPSLVLAGGAVRGVLFNEKIQDFDLFFIGTDKDKLREEIKEIREFLKMLDAKEIFICPMGFLYSYSLPISGKYRVKIQLINRYINKDIKSLLSRFDYTNCTFAYKNDSYYCLEPSIRHTISRTPELIYLGYPVSAVNRLYKYRKRGYDMRKAIVQIVQNLVLIGLRANQSEDELMEALEARLGYYID